METYVRWRNAGPRDQKISDREMARWLFALVISPLLAILAALHYWRFHLQGVPGLKSGAGFAKELTVASIKAVLFWLQSEWVRITEFPDD